MSVELEERLREKEESVTRAQKKMEEEYVRCQKEMEVEAREAKKKLARAKGDCKEKYSKLGGAIDEELELSPPSPPKGMLSQKRTGRLLKNHRNMSSAKTCGNNSRGFLFRYLVETSGRTSWKAAFMACVNKAPATAEYKLLQQLRA